MAKRKKIPYDKNYIIVRGAKVNNLKNIDLDIPHNKLVVFTGLSGSGKTSLVFDTIYAEGQRRYIESLSSYARQFLERIKKPDVDVISGLAPSMAIERKTQARNPRSTVGTTTEIYDYLRLLFARAGKTYSPISNEVVKKDSVDSIVNFIKNFKDGVRIYIVFPIPHHGTRKLSEEIEILKQKGFVRLYDGFNIIDLNKFSESDIDSSGLDREKIKAVADRFVYSVEDEELHQRIADSLEMAYNEGEGYLSVLAGQNENKSFREYPFNSHLEKDGIRFVEPEPELFSFNNPVGACPKCQGFGETIDIDPDLVIPDKTKSVFSNAIHPFSTPKHSRHLSDLISASRKYDIRLHEPFVNLNTKELEFIWKGGGEYIGINKFFRMVEREAAYKIHYRVLLSRYRAYTTCNECGGSRLRKEALYIKFKNKTIHDIVISNIEELYNFFRNLKPDKYEKDIAGRLIDEITNRLKYLWEVGLGYLTLNRLSNTLSGGETQRINLATTLGSSLVGSIYVLDEPSIGLHPRDNDRLIKILKSLRDIGNSVLVVEHDPEMMYASDHIVDIGPKAGEEGGEVMYNGSVEGIKRSAASLTGKYLSGRMSIEIPEKRRPINDHFISIKGATENNLKNVTVDIPLSSFVCITGVSGSGKSTLISDILYGALKKKLEGIYNDKIGRHLSLSGQQYINAVELVDQSPIGKTPRSNPVTYLKIFELIRDLYGNLPGSKLKGYTPGSFSFNIPGGRCETCEGSGVIKIAMQFMADIFLECDVCKGRRYKSDILEIEYNEKNISDILEFTVSEAIRFFKGYPKIVFKLKILEEVGLGYLRLGQSATTLSGGEAQRIKLAYHLTFQETGSKTLFIFDEPTTGLHIHDISKLLKSFNRLLEKGNSIVVVEHNLEVIKCADHIIDLGPDSGDKGGEVVAIGTPEEVAKIKNSFTGKYLAQVLKN